MATENEPATWDIYAILAIQDGENATIDMLKKAYRVQAVVTHPDKNPDDPDAAEKFDRLTRAYAYILVPENKQNYDTTLKAQRDVQKLRAAESAATSNLRQDLRRREEAAAATKSTTLVQQEAAAKANHEWIASLRALSERALHLPPATSVPDAMVTVTWPRTPEGADGPPAELVTRTIGGAVIAEEPKHMIVQFDSVRAAADACVRGRVTVEVPGYQWELRLRPHDRQAEAAHLEKVKDSLLKPVNIPYPVLESETVPTDDHLSRDSAEYRVLSRLGLLR